VAHNPTRSKGWRSCGFMFGVLRPHRQRVANPRQRGQAMSIKDLQSILDGATAKAFKTLYELAKYCEAKGLNTNADKLAHFSK